MATTCGSAGRPSLAVPGGCASGFAEEVVFALTLVGEEFSYRKERPEVEQCGIRE